MDFKLLTEIYTNTIALGWVCDGEPVEDPHQGLAIISLSRGRQHELKNAKGFPIAWLKNVSDGKEATDESTSGRIYILVPTTTFHLNRYVSSSTASFIFLVIR